MAATIADLGDYVLEIATTLAIAQRKLAGINIDLFIIGVHFDDSHVIDLIHSVRHNEAYKRTPIVVVRTNASTYAAMIRQTMVALKNNQQIEEYLELENEPNTSKIIRERVVQYVSPGRID